MAEKREMGAILGNSCPSLDANQLGPTKNLAIMETILHRGLWRTLFLVVAYSDG